MGNSAIHRAAANNDVKKLEKLLSKKSDERSRLNLVNKKAPDGNTPLHHAVYYVKGDVLDAVQFLVEHGAKIDATDKDGDTPLHYACKYGKKRVVRYLLDRGSKAYSMVVSPQLVARAHGHFDLSDLIDEFAQENSMESMQRRQKSKDRRAMIRNENIMNLFGKLDLDRNNLLSRDELLHFVTRFKQRARHSIALDKLNEAIEQFDVNKDGNIDRKEWIGFIGAFLSGFDEEYINVICNALVKEPVYLDASPLSLPRSKLMEESNTVIVADHGTSGDRSSRSNSSSISSVNSIQMTQAQTAQANNHNAIAAIRVPSVQLSWTGANVDVGLAMFDEQRMEIMDGSPVCCPKRPIAFRGSIRHHGSSEPKRNQIDIHLSKIPPHVHIIMFEAHSTVRAKEWSSGLSLHTLTTTDDDDAADDDGNDNDNGGADAAIERKQEAQQREKPAPQQHKLLYNVSVSPDDFSMGMPVFFMCRCNGPSDDELGEFGVGVGGEMSEGASPIPATPTNQSSSPSPLPPQSSPSASSSASTSPSTREHLWKIMNIHPLYGTPYKRESKSKLNSFEMFDNFLQKRTNVEMNIKGAVGRVRVISAKGLTPPQQGIMTSRYKITFMDKLVEMGKAMHMTVSPEWNGNYNTISYSKDCGGVYKFLFEVVDQDKMQEDNFMGQAELIVDLNENERVEYRNRELKLQPRRRTDVVSGSIFVDVDLRSKEMVVRGSRHTCDHLDLNNGSLNMSNMKRSTSAVYTDNDVSLISQ